MDRIGEEQTTGITSISETKDIKNMIYVVRGQQVMLDNDLAALYGYEVNGLMSR